MKQETRDWFESLDIDPESYFVLCFVGVPPKSKKNYKCRDLILRFTAEEAYEMAMDLKGRLERK